MTVILTVLFDNVVIQASDRRVSHSTTYTVHDDSANKSVIYVGAGCRLLLGYTGVAYIRGVPTDAWLVQHLAEKVGWRSPVGAGSGVHFSTNHAVLNAQEVLTTLAADLPKGIDICVAGYQKTRKADVARCWTVRRGQIACDTPENVPHGVAYGVLIPQGWQTDYDMREFLRELQNASSPRQYAPVLARAIQRIASHSPGVGSDVMVVAVSRYERYMEAGLYSQEPRATAAGSYTPAALFPGVIMPPSRLEDTKTPLVIGRGWVSPDKPFEGRREHMLVLNVNRGFGDPMSIRPQPRPSPPTRSR